jgi:hypothetical protein
VQRDKQIWFGYLVCRKAIWTLRLEIETYLNTVKFWYNAPLTSRQWKSVNENSPLYSISIYCHPRNAVVNCDEQRVALYWGLNTEHWWCTVPTTATCFGRIFSLSIIEYMCVQKEKLIRKHCCIASEHTFEIPYFSIDNPRVIYTKRSKFVKNEHARYTLGMKKGKNLERLITATSQARF